MKNKIKPNLPQNAEFTQVKELKRGECFIINGELHMLTDMDPMAVNLSTGERGSWGEEIEIIPVIIEINWKRKPR